MKLRQLRILDVVARCRSVTNAASQLNMSQPAVSLQLKLLEAEYERQFLTRTNRGVELTEQGQHFLDRIRPVLAQVEELEASFKARRAPKEKAKLVVGGSNMLSATLLPELSIAFRKTHPHVTLEVETKYSHLVEEGILAGRVDVGLIGSPSRNPDLVYETYKKSEAVAFVAPGHPLANRTVSLAELSRHPLIARKNSSNSVAQLRKYGYPLNFVLHCHAPESVKAAVKGGGGVGILYRGLVQLEIAMGELCQVHVPELKDVMVHSFIVYGRRRALSANAEDFLNLLRSTRTVRPRTAPPARKRPQTPALAVGGNR